MDDDDSDDVSRCTAAREARESILSEIWPARESAWEFRSGRFFSSYVDWRKTIPMKVAVS